MTAPAASLDTDALDVDLVELEHLPDEFQEDARGFVISSWVQSYCDFRPPGMGRALYAARQRELALRLMDEHVCRVATLPGAPDCFVGWACSNPGGDALHYVYVKQGYRRAGVARRLVGSPKVCTHRPTTSHVRAWAERLGVVHDPYQLMR